MPRRFLSYLLPPLIGAGMIGAWFAIHHALSDDQKFLLPTPADVVAALRDNADSLAHASLNTIEASLLGFLGAATLSFLFALGLSSSRLVRISFYPYLMILQMIPIIILAPIFVLWIGPGLKSVALLTFFICFFPLVVNTTQGLISTDRNLVELFQMYRATRFQETFRLRVPAAMPYFFTGLRIAAVLAPIGALTGDMFAGSSAAGGDGLGFQAIIFSSRAQYPALFATAVVTCVLGFVFVAIVLALSWLALHKWHDSYARTDN